jgi:hypothetical protein
MMYLSLYLYLTGTGEDRKGERREEAQRGGGEQREGKREGEENGSEAAISGGGR